MRTPTRHQLLGLLGLLTIAALVVGLSGCANDDRDAASNTTKTGAAASKAGDDPATTAAQADSSTPATSSSKLPDPCTLVSLEIASEILGGQSAAPEPGGTTATGNTAACSWQTQESKDNPTLDNAGHVLTLSVFGAPNPSMTTKQLFESTKSVGDGTTPADVDGCDDAFWSGGMLSALKGDIYVSGTAGLADESAAAKTGASKLVAAACASLG